MKRSIIRRCGIPFMALAILLAGSSAVSDPVVRLVDKETVTLRIWPLTVAQTDEAEASRTLEIGDEATPELDMDLPWPDPEVGSRLHLKAERIDVPSGNGVRVRIEAELTPPDGQPMRSSRDLAFEDSTTALFEVARIDDRPLTLAVEARRAEQTVASVGAAVGPPVVLHVEIKRVDGAKAISLETNRLSTFVGEPVSYSFKLGESATSDAAHVELLPIQILDDLLRIDVEVSATLPGDDGEPSLISRREQWATTRGATTVLAVETGDPPKGYRFLVTASF